MLWKDIPIMNVPGSEIGDIMIWDTENQRKVVSGTEVEDYLKYVSEIEEAGFHKYKDYVTTNSLVYTSLYTKGEVLLIVMHIKPQKRTFISVCKREIRDDKEVERLFEGVPSMGNIVNMSEKAEYYGAGNYVVTIDQTEKTEYDEYLRKLEEAGFLKYVDNKEGLNETVFCATYQRGNLVVTVTHVLHIKKSYISVCRGLPLSEHLLYSEKNIRDNKRNMKTTLHMLELQEFGNSFVIQLKNGHFIISDGGIDGEIDYLLNYIEGLTLENEKPIIEAWFVSHAHRDHCGVFRAIAKSPEYAERLYVEEIYYNEPSECVTAFDLGVKEDIAYIRKAAEVLHTTKNSHPQIYRPQTGQRYYFCDITVDIIMAQEQLPCENYSGDFNDSSTWCMLNIEGQKCLLGGDGDKGGMLFIMGAYDKKYLELDVFTLLHHGWNTRDIFTDYCTVKTVLFTMKGEVPKVREKETKHLLEAVEEWFSWKDGTRVLKFPYKVGTSQCLLH